MRSSIRTEIIAYFTDRKAHFSPSQIDWAMGLVEGTAHDVIVDWWAKQKEKKEERLRSYHE